MLHLLYLLGVHLGICAMHLVERVQLGSGRDTGVEIIRVQRYLKQLNWRRLSVESVQRTGQKTDSLGAL